MKVLISLFLLASPQRMGPLSATLERKGTDGVVKTADGVDWKKELGAYRLILGYRNKGHLIAKTNPIRPRKDRGANLDLGFFGLTEEDLKKNFYAGNLIGLGTTSLENILRHLQQTYASNVGIEFKYISDQKKVDWLTTEMEKTSISRFPLRRRGAYSKSSTRV